MSDLALFHENLGSSFDVGALLCLRLIHLVGNPSQHNLTDCCLQFGVSLCHAGWFGATGAGAGEHIEGRTDRLQ